MLVLVVQEVLTTALESGISTLLVPSSAVTEAAAKQFVDWQQLGRFSTVLCQVFLLCRAAA